MKDKKLTNHQKLAEVNRKVEYLAAVVTDMSKQVELLSVWSREATLLMEHMPCFPEALAKIKELSKQSIKEEQQAKDVKPKMEGI